LGPRGTGKSFFIKSFYPEAYYIDLLQLETFHQFQAHPDRLIDIVQAQVPLKNIIVIDEIQNVPQLLSVVHHLIEKYPSVQFILTGSSARKLRRSHSDLLAGRALLYYMHPFVAHELCDQFQLEQTLKYGLIPLIVSSSDPRQALKTYVALYIREEVYNEGLTRNIAGFSRFLEAISFSHGCCLNISNVARECMVERKVVESYVTILEDLLIGYRIQVFTKRAKRAISAQSKFYFFDVGLFQALRPVGYLDSSDEIAGSAMEGLVFQHLLAVIDYQQSDAKLYYWRTKSGSEVDFIVYGKSVFWAIEVKHSINFHPQDLRSLKAFMSDYPEAKAIFIYRGKEKQIHDNISVIPCTEFLKDYIFETKDLNP